MNILEKIKSIDTTKITDATLTEQITTSLSFYDDREQLTAQEVAVYEKLYNRADKHIKDGEAKATDAEQKRLADEKKAADDTAAAAATSVKKEKGAAIKAAVWPHQQYMNENGATFKDFPREVQKMNNGFGMILGKYANNPDHEPTKTAVTSASNKMLKAMQAHMDTKATTDNAAAQKILDDEAAAKKKTDDDASAQKKVDDDAAAKKKADDDKAVAAQRKKSASVTFFDDLLD